MAGALIRCAAQSARPGASAEADWRTICSWLELYFDSHLLGAGQAAAMHRRLLLAGALNRWYAQSASHALVSVEKDRLIIRPTVSTLFGVIGLQLAYQVTGADRMLVCYHCQEFFSVSRKPPAGVRTFCPKCRRASRPIIYAMRDYRQRQSARRRGS